jgi:hypothetical protein
MNRGVSAMGQYLYEDAVQAFEEVLAATPDLTEAKLDLAIALFNRNRKEDLDAAGKVLASVLEREPQNLRALYFQAIVLQHIGKAEAAIPGLEAVVRGRPDDGAAWYLLALCKQRAGQAAEAEYLRAVEHRPYLYSAYYQLYQAAMRSGQEARAREYLDRFKALRESPLGESIELPQYNQMGELALARPLPAATPNPIARSQYRLRPPEVLFTAPEAATHSPNSGGWPLDGIAVGDLDRDGRLDLVATLGHRALFLRQTEPGRFTEATAASGFGSATGVAAVAIGDWDNDEVPDLFLAGDGGGQLFKGKGEGTFSNVTTAAGMIAATDPSRSALFLDADHDGDLDLFVAGAGGNRLWNNNGNGVFTNIATAAGLATDPHGAMLVLPGDVDRDRDLDLVLLPADGPGQLLINELLGHYRTADLHGLEIRGDAGGVLQDLNGDGALDLLLLGGQPRQLALLLGDGHGQFQPDGAFASAAKALASWGDLRGIRVADMDLDGDLDVLVCGTEVHLLLNDGRGRFVMRSQLWKPSTGQRLAGIECLDLNGDFVPDLVVTEIGAASRVTVAWGELNPPSTALALRPTGVRSRDGRTRSPASGYGVLLTARSGLHETRRLFVGQTGGANQSLTPVVFGLAGIGKADYVDLLWPDGVAQAEVALAAGQTHTVAELQRKVSSCPVLFAWNGSRFGFVTDFAGVGGLGYFVAPGVSATPQVLEHVKIEADQLCARAGKYELRVTEPMEEAAYVDRLELLAIDHEAGVEVFPDERLAIGGPVPTHELLVVEAPIYPVHATDSAQHECAGALIRTDRLYAYEPVLDRRYVGFCPPHTLELDFGDALAPLATTDRLFLFVNGFIEYPYSQTVYAAGQSGVGWEPIRVDRQNRDGRWETVVPDAGAPGGMARTMTIDLTGQIAPETRRLRLTTNLEIGYDRIFVARVQSPERATVRTVPLREATLRRLGFAREYSPDGRQPLVYDYDQTDATAPFHTLAGAYTRYGSVLELLTEFDDRYAVLAPGDELALSFDAAALPAPETGRVRSFVLVSHAYCKDMDLYTATPRTLGPLPFKAMSRYPYPATESYPTGWVHQSFLETYNTRWID